MEFKTKAAVAEWVNDQSMTEIATYYNGLPGVKLVKKFESREVAVTRIWAIIGGESADTAADKPKMAQKPKAAGKKATSGRKPGKTATTRMPKAAKGDTVRAQAIRDAPAG